MLLTGPGAHRYSAPRFEHVTTIDSPTFVAERGRAGRIRLYLGQMFPLPTMAAYAVCHFFAFWFSLQALAASRIQVTWASLRGVLTIFLVLLLMRLYDELKDAQTDIALGRAGDPLYRDRVLVTGAVRLEDVVLLRWIVTAALVAVNVGPRFGLGSVMFWLLFGVMWLSFNWFFWPAVSRNLLLAFVTHNPISLLVGLYVVGLFVDQFGATGIDGRVLLLLLGLWLPMAAWETSRKIRVPEDETSYMTYSRALGWKLAGILPALFAAGSTAALVAFSISATLNLVFPMMIALMCGIVVYRSVLFRVAPSRQRADLKPWAILFTTIANAGMVAAVLMTRGIAW